MPLFQDPLQALFWKRPQEVDLDSTLSKEQIIKNDSEKQIKKFKSIISQAYGAKILGVRKMEQLTNYR